VGGCVRRRSILGSGGNFYFGCAAGGRAGAGEPGAEAGQRDPQGRELFRPGDGPATAQVVEFVDKHREQFGVGPICAVLGCAASTYHAARTRPPSARQQRDERLKGEVLRVNAEYLASIKPGAPQAAVRTRAQSQPR